MLQIEYEDADELVFLDITATCEHRDTIVKFLVIIVTSTLVILPREAIAHAASVPQSFHLAMSIHIGWEVDRTTHGRVCSVASGDECLSLKESSEPGGFKYPSSVATDPRTGNLYVADLDNFRIQEFTAAGAFITMFGWDVNGTKTHKAGTSQVERNICTASSGDWCTAGERGTAAGQIAYPLSVTVDPGTGDVYVLEADNNDDRVDKYTSDGHFVWAIGKGVNATTKASICSEREVVLSGVRCKAGAEGKTSSIERSSFKSPHQYGNLLAVGGPDNLLYVADEHRVQEFDSAGRWRREISLASISAAPGSSVTSLAVDIAGDLYLVYRTIINESGAVVEHVNVVRKLGPDGEQISQFAVYPKRSSATAEIDGITVDSAHRIAVIGVEMAFLFHKRFGLVYDGDTGRLVSEYMPPQDNDGITFNDKDDLYVAATDNQEVIAYVPAPVAELVTSPVACEIAPEKDTVVAFNCALSGAAPHA